MSDLLNLILSIGATAFMAFVALFLILLSSYKKEFWEAIYEDNKHKSRQRFKGIKNNTNK